jgi:hypothetical protein
MRLYYWSTTRDLKAYVWAEVEEDIDELETISKGTTEEGMRKHPVLSDALDRWRSGEETVYVEAMAHSLVHGIEMGDGPATTWTDSVIAAICREHMDIPTCVTALDLAARVDAIQAEATAFVGDTQAMIDLHAELAELRDATQ